MRVIFADWTESAGIRQEFGLYTRWNIFHINANFFLGVYGRIFYLIKDHNNRANGVCEEGLLTRHFAQLLLHTLRLYNNYD